nr:hypothetical protein [uncultured Methanospirillum sp.]
MAHPRVWHIILQPGCRRDKFVKGGYICASSPPDEASGSDQQACFM